MKLQTTLCVGLLISGIALAQAPTQPPRPPRPGNLKGRPAPPDRGPLMGPNAERRLTRSLGLDAAQQNKVHTALEEQNVQTKGMEDRARDLRTQLAAAVRAGDESKIDQITRDMSQVQQQRSAVAAKTLAKVYGALNADQKSKMDSAVDRELGMPGPRGGPGGPRRRPGPPPQPPQNQ